MTQTQPWWEWGLWNYRAVATQANAGGGAVTLDVEAAEGDYAILGYLMAVNSGTNSLRVRTYDEDNNTAGEWGSVASAATTILRLPASGDPANSDENIMDSTPPNLQIRSDLYLSVQQLGAGAQNDTLTLTMGWYLASAALPTVVKTRSTNQADVTLAAPTVSKII